MWQVELKAKDKKDAHAQLNEHPQSSVIPLNVLTGAHEAIDALEKPIKGQLVFVQTYGHSDTPSSWNAVVHASLMDEEKSPE